MARKTSFWERLEQVGDCWVYTGLKTYNGYGQINVGGFRRAHRYAWSELRGPIPEGLDLDHLCKNRACCNPDHLEVVTTAVNNARANGFPGGVQTHCLRGHEFTPENTRIFQGERRCRACQRIYRERERMKRSA